MKVDLDRFLDETLCVTCSSFDHIPGKWHSGKKANLVMKCGSRTIVDVLMTQGKESYSSLNLFSNTCGSSIVQL